MLATIVGLTVDSFTQVLLAQAAIFAIIVLGLNVLVGYTGQISFGHNAFVGVGAYITAALAVDRGIPPLLGLVAGIAVALVLAVIIGWPTLRLRGHFLAMATFGLGLAFHSFVVASPIFKGFIGISGIPPLGVGSMVSSSAQGQYVLTVIVLVLAIVVAWRLKHGRFGRALNTIANDEATAQSIGVDVQRYKLAAFAVSAVFGAVGGWLYAHTVLYVSPETFGFSMIITLFTILFLGGVSSVWGTVAGSVIVTVIPQVVPEGVQVWEPTIFSVALLFVLIVRPDGLFSPSPALAGAWSRRFGASRGVAK